MKNAGKACNNRLYRHIRTFEKIIKNYFVIYKTLVKYNNTGYASAMAVIFIIVLVVFTLVFMQSLWNPKKK